MADESTAPDSRGTDEQPVEVVGDGEYRFANGFDVAQPQTMVYLDFFQQDPREPTEGLRVGGLVIHPALVPLLIERLSAVRQEDGGAG
jgi:hypothetical protein